MGPASAGPFCCAFLKLFGALGRRFGYHGLVLEVLVAHSLPKCLLAGVVLSSALFASGCNAGAIAMGFLLNNELAPNRVGGSLTNAPANTKIGYVSWIEQLNDGTTTGRLNFDLVRDRTVSFDRLTTPGSDAKYSLEIQPKAQTAEGTYVVFAWEDTNGDNIYQADNNEKRAPEVYRVRGQAAQRALWTAEKYVFTDKKLEIQFAELGTGLAFTF